MSLSTQSKISSKFLEYAKNVSLNNTAGLLEYMIFKSRKSCQITKILIRKCSATANKIIENIRELHQTLGFHRGQKFNILSLVASLHSQKSLRYFGFVLSYKQYKLVRENAIGRGLVELSGSFYHKVQISVLTSAPFIKRNFSLAEAHQNINTITELNECFERKAHVDSLTRGNGNAGKYNFKVYPRDVPRSERYQVKIKNGIKLFLSIIFIEGKLLASPICSEDLASYNPVAYKETSISDKRSNKYASDHIQRGSSGDALMRPSYIEILKKRVGMLRGVRGGGEGKRLLSNDVHCKR
ncbi:hypothetical protein BB560_005998 [Smittium megazygosporum]|uniref:Uncharacterized protein n=1 Tax=Smittium megazygosporum TaxID=133381 RepID=A0A2T9YM09_9FUNG|nr:hypothetical protein BB560_005998 [Smittium megazygosporum]